MHTTLRKGGLCTALILAALPAFGSQEKSRTIVRMDEKPSSTIPDQGYRLHASLGAGFGSLMGGEFQSSPSGTTTLGTIGIGRRTRRWEWDTNLGWGYSPRSGLDSAGRPVSIKIRSGRADFSARYRLLPFLQVGPIVTANFGTDTRFNTSMGNSVATFYGGAKGVLDIGAAGRFPVEAWAEGLTELSSFGRDAVTLLAGVRISLPVSAPTIDFMKLSQASPRRDVRVALDSRKVFFKTSSSKIRPEIARTLQQVSMHLAKNAADWDALEISGHADIRGPKEYNDRLSMRRALSVKKALVSEGIDLQRVSVEAFGYAKPAVDGNDWKAWKQNRRVELTFRNVSHPAALEALLAPLGTDPARTNGTERN